MPGTDAGRARGQGRLLANNPWMHSTQGGLITLALRQSLRGRGVELRIDPAQREQVLLTPERNAADAKRGCDPEDEDEVRLLVDSPRRMPRRAKAALTCASACSMAAAGIPADTAGPPR